MPTTTTFQRPSLTRLAIYLAILLISQCFIAYSAILVFSALPQSITGIIEQQKAMLDSQQGAIALIFHRISEQPEVPPQQALEQLDIFFAYPLQFIPAETPLPEDIRGYFAMHGQAYDKNTDLLYAGFNADLILQMGPMIAPDLLDADFMPFWIFLMLWSAISSVVFFVLLYLAFSYLRRDMLNIRITAEQLGQGNLKARAHDIHSWLFKPLAMILNDMAHQIERLVQASQVISQAMAHELRTPLARIRFGLSMSDEASDPQERAHYRQGIDLDLAELESLVNVSLDYFRLQHKIVLHRTQVSLSRWSQQLCESLQPLLPSEIQLDCHVTEITMEMDEKLMKVALSNLLLNAFHYAAHRVDLRVEQKGDQLLLIVDDDGTGVPLDSRQTIFEPFTRLASCPQRVTANKTGYGLGLAYVELITKSHHGHVFVMTSPLGGARFIIALPSS